MPHRLIVAWGFCIGAFAIGVPGAIDFVHVVQLFNFVTHDLPQPGQPLDVQRFGLPGFVSDIWLLFTPIAGLIGGLLILGIVLGAIMCAIWIGFAIFMLLTGRAAILHRDWAKSAGIVLAIVIFFASFSNLQGAYGAWLIMPCIGIAGSLYAIWVLGWRYSSAPVQPAP
ncbi:MAG TPA: hypothetical protein VHW02_05710 [Rhizomicrobium sp.]|jgi:hypothetical protein|nr:hypothetical protein [Rhizomicrobium sp.]